MIESYRAAKSMTTYLIHEMEALDDEEMVRAFVDAALLLESRIHAVEHAAVPLRLEERAARKTPSPKLS